MARGFHGGVSVRVRWYNPTVDTKAKAGIKRRPNQELYLAALRKMTPEQRLLKAFELSEFSKQINLHGLRTKFPEMSEPEIRKMYLEGLNKCHNRNY